MENIFHIQWHVTERCNLNCIHCYKEPYREELPFEKLSFIADNILSFIEERNLKLVLTLTGGEPFLKEEVYPLAYYLNNFRYYIEKINFISNGTVLPQENLVKKINKIGNYYISLESFLEEDNDRIRGRGVFCKVVDNIRLLEQMGYNISVMITLLSENINNIIDKFDELILFFSKQKVSEIVFERFVSVGQAKDKIDKIVPPQKILNFYKVLCDFYEIPFVEEEMKKYKAIKVVFGDNISNIFAAQCTAGKEGIAVLCDGTVYPCRRLDIPIGNLLMDKMQDIIPNKGFDVGIQNKDTFNCLAMTKNFWNKL